MSEQVEVDVTHRISADEVIRRFPEVQRISDNEIRALTIDALRYTPDYFWTVPASTSGKYHNPLARGKHGLWIHTKMAFTVMEGLAESWVAQGIVTERDADMARSAMLVHDQYKQGLPADRDPNNPDHCHTDGDHDVLAAEWFAEYTDLPDAVIHAVAAHNGPSEATGPDSYGWGEGPAPYEHDDETARNVAQLVHSCDMMGSRATVTPDVWEPADELVEEYGDDLPVADSL